MCYLVDNAIYLFVIEVNGRILLQQGCKQALHFILLYHSCVLQIIDLEGNCRAAKAQSDTVESAVRTPRTCARSSTPAMAAWL